MLESILRSDLTSQMLDVLTGIPLGETAFFLCMIFRLGGRTFMEMRKILGEGKGMLPF